MFDNPRSVVLAAINLINSNNLQDAEIILSKGLSLFPRRSECKYFLGLVNFFLGNCNVSEDYIFSSMRALPHSEKPTYVLSQIYNQTNRPYMSKILMERFNEINLHKNKEKIFVIGDSHGEQSFSGITSCLTHLLGFYTMHRIGRDGLNVLDISKHITSQYGVCVFVFGEIDVRLHIGKQHREIMRSPESIIKDLVRRYFSTIKKNMDMFPNILAVVSAVLPPLEKRDTDLFPKLGSLDDRVMYCNMLNEEIKIQCGERSFHFLDIFTPFSMEDGSMNPVFSDDGVHIKREFYRVIESILMPLVKSSRADNSTL